jgi:hypothetical protein
VNCFKSIWIHLLHSWILETYSVNTALLGLYGAPYMELIEDLVDGCFKSFQMRCGIDFPGFFKNLSF